MRRHLVVLLLLTVVVRGVMMISYPLGGTDDNQAAQNYLISQLLQGNLLIGNLRYQTGYPFAIAPVVAIAQHFGRFDDRIILLFQSALSATIPFMVYDIVRRIGTSRQEVAERAAFIIALFVLLDPFGLQWAHFYLPEWLIAWTLIAALWLLQLRNGSWRMTLLAGILLGFASLMRFNFVPVVVGLTVLLLVRPSDFPIRQRIIDVGLLAIASGGIVVLYLLLIHYPSTGTLRPNCVSGINLIEDVESKGLQIRAENGAASARYIELLARHLPQEILFLNDTYYRWQQPEAWATPEEKQAFLENTLSGNSPTTAFSLVYYLGPCPTDSLLQSVYFETVASNPARWLTETLSYFLNSLMQIPVSPAGQSVTFALPYPSQLVYKPGNTFGFRQAVDSFYTGQWVWAPGIELFSSIFPIWNLMKVLTIPAIFWAFWSRKWFYAAAAVLLMIATLSLSIVDVPEPRIYAAVYPLWSIVIGGLIAVVLQRLSRSHD